MLNKIAGFLLFIIICQNFVLAQSQNNTYLTHSKLDKIIIKRLQLDSLEWFFEDYENSIDLDSKWQTIMTDQSLFKNQQKIYQNQTYFSSVNTSLSTAELKERLQNINAKTPLDIYYHPDLEKVIHYYLKNQKKHTERLMSLGEYYFPMFESIFDKYNIPLEIKYLALVESALNPRAKSWVGATGLWQFMFSTGKMYDLDISSYVDERMDPIRSTEASARYLKHLYSIYEDWNLALAAYNSGPGNVNKAIRRSGGKKNYWAIRPYLPKETAGYIPSFMAMLYIFEYANEHNYQPEIPEIPLYATDTIQVKGLIKLEQVSKITNTDLEILKFLNPSYKLDIIPKDKEKNYTLRLPYKAVGLFVTNEDKIYAYAQKEIEVNQEKIPKYYKIKDKIRYRVKSGDYLGKIAKRYGVRVGDIKRWNGLKSTRLKIGQRLTIYPRKA